MNWETLYCPNKACVYYGVTFSEGKLVSGERNKALLIRSRYQQK